LEKMSEVSSREPSHQATKVPSTVGVPASPPETGSSTAGPTPVSPIMLAYSPSPVLTTNASSETATAFAGAVRSGVGTSTHCPLEDVGAPGEVLPPGSEDPVDAGLVVVGTKSVLTLGVGDSSVSEKTGMNKAATATTTTTKKAMTPRMIQRSVRLF
jgi:hypothetical protein